MIYDLIVKMSKHDPKHPINCKHVSSASCHAKYHQLCRFKLLLILNSEQIIHTSVVNAREKTDMRSRVNSISENIVHKDRSFAI